MQAVKHLGDREQQGWEAAGGVKEGERWHCQPSLGLRAQPGGADLEQALPSQAKGTLLSVINVSCFIFSSSQL